MLRDSCATDPAKVALKPRQCRTAHLDSTFDPSALAEVVSPLHNCGAPCTRERCKRRSCCVSARSSLMFSRDCAVKYSATIGREGNAGR